MRPWIEDNPVKKYPQLLYYVLGRHLSDNIKVWDRLIEKESYNTFYSKPFIDCASEALVIADQIINERD